MFSELFNSTGVQPLHFVPKMTCGKTEEVWKNSKLDRASDEKSYKGSFTW